MAKNYRALQVELEARPDHGQRAAETKATLEAQDAAYFRRLSELRHKSAEVCYRVGCRTTVTKKLSIWRMTSMKQVKLTGLVT